MPSIMPGFAPASRFFVAAGNPLQTRKHSLAILGAGHGGLALAGYLAHHGHRVSLWNRSPARIAPVKARGGIRLTMPGSATSHMPIATATCNMGTALADARRILVAVPASGHAMCSFPA
jgi:opine dehydrogenase